MKTITSAFQAPGSPVLTPKSKRHAPYRKSYSPRECSIAGRDSISIGVPADSEQSPDAPRGCISRTGSTIQACFNALSAGITCLLRRKAQAASEKTALANLQLDDAPNISAFRDHIVQGLKMIQAGQYEDAIRHFHNENAVRNIGYSLAGGEDLYVSKIPTSQNEINDVVETYARLPICFSERKWIKLARIQFISQNCLFNILEPKTSEEQQALNQIRQEEALIHAEEHIHALQDLLGRNIHFSEPGIADDHEVDIAATLAAEKVPMTEAFLKRYGRNKYIKPKLRK